MPRRRVYATAAAHSIDGVELPARNTVGPRRRRLSKAMLFSSQDRIHFRPICVRYEDPMREVGTQTRKSAPTPRWYVIQLDGLLRNL